MKISCNRLKKYIKNCEDIDWIKIWDTFTIRIAEVEGVEVKGNDVEDVVVAQITSCVTHPKKDKYHILKVNNGKEELDILCGAPNVREGMKVALVNVGGKVSGFTIEEKTIAGILSKGMLVSEEELGVGYDDDGIIELPDEYEVGKSIKEYIPIDDIIVEIDNKSLTNRPDLWGHYGIAREIAAITNHELISLDLENVENNLSDLDIKVNNPDLCLRYTGLKIGNITNNVTPWDIKIFLYYVGMRSISLIVDLTNYIMLELGTPMHAFDASKVKNIEVGLANDGDEFTTLDGVTRKLSNETLMIKNNNEYYAVAGFMGGLDSEIVDDTSSIVLESAVFDATSVRKSATHLGLRTEASARYEKSLDPNMAILATKRYLYLLRRFDTNIEILSNLTDIYPNKLEEPTIKLYKNTLNTYMGTKLDSTIVKRILESLHFTVKEEEEYYDVTVPTFRATKDISIEEDLIEEVARIYGYENIEKKPLMVDLAVSSDFDQFNPEYEIKKYLATKYNMNEVNTYLWYKTDFLNEMGIQKDNVKLLSKSEDNVLRDDLSLSLVEVLLNNSKYYSNCSIFEIGTVIKNNANYKQLSFALMDDDKNISKSYYKAKEIINNLFRTFKNYNVKFTTGLSVIYQVENLSLTIVDYIYQYLDEVLLNYKNELIDSYDLVGVYQTDKNKNYTIRFKLVSYERTLTSKDIELFQTEFINYIKSKGLKIVE